MRVAMLVHNTVVSDSRVIKSARSLQRGGHEVTVFGYGASEGHPCQIDGFRLIIVPPATGQFIYLFFSQYFDGFSHFDRSFKSISYLLAPLRLVLSPLRRLLPLSRTIASHYLIAKSIGRRVKPEDFDAIHAHDLISLLCIKRLKKNNPRLKVIWDAHELYPELAYKTKGMRLFAKKIISSLRSELDGFITINDSLARYYEANFPLLPRATILKNATSRSAPMVAEKKLSPLRESARIDQSQLILLSQGGLSIGRGIEILVQAAYKIPKNWSIVVMGDGSLSGLVDAASSELSSTRASGKPAIIRIPPAPYVELNLWTMGADLGIIPYQNTGLNHLYCTPNKLWEFPSAFVPVLAAPLVEMRKMILNYGIGILLVENFTASDIADVLQATTRQTLKPLVDACSQFNLVENWEQTYEPRLLNLYKMLEDIDS